jgi:hypothetical protein
MLLLWVVMLCETEVNTKISVEHTAPIFWSERAKKWRNSSTLDNGGGGVLATYNHRSLIQE